jgi:DNA-directed RNA polymerase II subunit RPB1
MSIDPKYYSKDVKTIKKIEFSVYTNKEVLANSAVKNDPFGINLAESYSGFEPVKGGLVDPRMGTCDIYLPCTTCGLDYNDCPGHFGHIQLAEAVYHYGFFGHLKSVLQCICLQCSKVLIEKVDSVYKKLINKKSDIRFKEIKNLTKNTNYCYNCGTPVGKIKKEEKESTATIRLVLEREIGIPTVNEKTGEVIDNVKKIIKYLTPRDCYDIFKNLSDTECYILGFNPKVARPEDLIILNLPIAPIIIRPTAKIDFTQASTMEDSLTLKYADVINAVKRVKTQMEKEVTTNELSVYNQDLSSLLQLHIIIIYDNESTYLPKSEFKYGGKPIKSISERIKSKTGRVRANLMGKRVDFSARSVITSDPYINIDEVGIPKKIAMELTFPEEVTYHNIKYLTELVRNGRDTYPGANVVFRIIYKDGKPEIHKIDLKYRKKSLKLNIGDIVERHIINGDYVLFNRQPSLHKYSMMAHKAHVIDNDDLLTLRMNVSTCAPYNADELHQSR